MCAYVVEEAVWFFEHYGFKPRNFKFIPKRQQPHIRNYENAQFMVLKMPNFERDDFGKMELPQNSIGLTRLDTDF